MKVNLILMVLGLFCLPVFSAKANQQQLLPAAEGSYFGQTTPGMTPKVFAADIVSIEGRYEYGVAFSPTMDEIYFSAQWPDATADIYYSTVESKHWQPINIANFTKGQKAGEMEPFVSYDGQQIYFTAYNADFTDTKIWIVNREATGWGKAHKLISPINDREVFNATLARNGDLFYTDIFKSVTSVARREKGQYVDPNNVNIAFGIHGFISPNQDYLLVDAQHNDDDDRKDSDIYVYFKQANGDWSEPISLGPVVNSSYSETVPTVTPDGKYLFFSRYDEQGGISNLYWVSSQVIELVRPITSEY
ncbi:hypothetical protein [Shewanella waksmanii]|uniref:hypothetical protein n=1 Tax=Shewanella waksmanii TaxID=213783 RepID=UPI0037354CE7